MRNQKSNSNFLFYLIALAVLAGFAFIAFYEVPVKQEQVEQPVPNSFLEK